MPEGRRIPVQLHVCLAKPVVGLCVLGRSLNQALIDLDHSVPITLDGGGTRVHDELLSSFWFCIGHVVPFAFAARHPPKAKVELSAGGACRLPDQIPRARFNDSYINQFAEQIATVGEVHEGISAGATAPAALLMAIHEDFMGLTDAGKVPLGQLAFLECFNCLVAAVLLRSSNVVVPPCRECSWTRGVHRNMHFVTGDFVEQTERVLKLGLGLARKSNDDVGGDGGPRHSLAGVGDPIAPEVGGVGPAHALEDVIVARLGGQIHVLANAWEFGIASTMS